MGKEAHAVDQGITTENRRAPIRTLSTLFFLFTFCTEPFLYSINIDRLKLLTIFPGNPLSDPGSETDRGSAFLAKDHSAHHFLSPLVS